MSIAFRILVPAFLCLLSLVVLPFAQHALSLGWQGLTGDLSGKSRLYSEGLANPAIFGHMIAGGLITVLAPLQLIPDIRHRRPALHRASGYILATAAGLTAVAGLAYIALRGTIGGPVMSFAFALYGALMLIAVVQTVRHARARRIGQHQRWALRLFVLAIGSWLYRVHYGVWFAATGGLASTPEFTGLFDKVTVFAFYLPYLVALECIFRLRPATGPVPHRPGGQPESGSG